MEVRCETIEGFKKAMNHTYGAGVCFLLSNEVWEYMVNHLIPNQPERSKREDFVYNFKILDRALQRAHREGAWDQEDYDAMFELVKEAKQRCGALNPMET